MSGTIVTSCRSCGSADLDPFLSLGSTPVANALLDPVDASRDTPSYPLVVVFCQSCSLVQLGYALPAEAIFDDDYPYYSSFSPALCDHAARHVRGLIADRDLQPHHLVVEVASNDGYLLRNVLDAGVRGLGVDPSPGPAKAAQEAGVPTIVDFFGVRVAEEIISQHGRAEVVVANNVMAHVPDLNDFVSGMARLVADSGVITIENPYVRELVEKVEFDTIYHEHYSYFSCSSVDALMRRHGLHLNDVEYFPDLHGGTLRWYVEPAPRRSQRCADYLARERADGMTESFYYEAFAGDVAKAQQSLRDLLVDVRSRAASVAAYGAAAKGATLLNSSRIGTELIDYVVDRNVHKHGKLMPGCNLPIRPVEFLLEDAPDYVVLLAWNFATEIVQQQAAYAARGGRFIVPVPCAHVL